MESNSNIINSFPSAEINPHVSSTLSTVSIAKGSLCILVSCSAFSTLDIKYMQTNCRKLMLHVKETNENAQTTNLWKFVMKNSVLALEAPGPKYKLCFTLIFKVLKNVPVLSTTEWFDRGFWLRFRSPPIFIWYNLQARCLKCDDILINYCSPLFWLELLKNWTVQISNLQVLAWRMERILSSIELLKERTKEHPKATLLKWKQTSAMKLCPRY